MGDKKCNFCTELEKIKEIHGQGKRENVTHKYKCAIVAETYRDGVYLGKTAYEGMELKYCPECGRKLENEITEGQGFLGQFSCQEDSGEGKTGPSGEPKSGDEPYAYVDGSYNVETGTPGYGGVISCNGKLYPFAGIVSDVSLYSMRNVAGEVYGAMAAVETAERLGLREIILYYDYAGIEEWALGRWKRNKDGTKAYKAFMDSTKVDVHFKKVKGHSGIKGNEIADILAKRAVGVGLTKKQAGLLEDLLVKGIL